MTTIEAPYGRSKAAARARLVRVAARVRRTPPVMLAVLAGLTVPLKAARLDVLGLSMYATFVVVAIVVVRHWKLAFKMFRRWFVAPLAVLSVFAIWGVLRGTGPVQPGITLMKLGVAFMVAAGFGVLTSRREIWLQLGLLAGSMLTVTYMAYQWVSSVVFGFALPFTTSAQLQIGLGLSSRYGLTRVTGFTEEPSFAATMLVGATLINLAYGYRVANRQFVMIPPIVGALGLAMATSNNLFATTIIIAAFWPLIRNRRVVLLFVTYYIAAVIVTPFVLLRDTTFFARFSAYEIFRISGPVEQLFGHGVGSYPQYFEANGVQYLGQDVASLASIWGGWLFEGGVVLVALVILWLGRVVWRAEWREGLALVALLLMLSNFNSPWWPIASLALAQCLVHTRRETQWNQTPT